MRLEPMEGLELQVLKASFLVASRLAEVGLEVAAHPAATAEAHQELRVGEVLGRLEDWGWKVVPKALVLLGKWACRANLVARAVVLQASDHQVP